MTQLRKNSKSFYFFLYSLTALLFVASIFLLGDWGFKDLVDIRTKMIVPSSVQKTCIAKIKFASTKKNKQQTQLFALDSDFFIEPLSVSDTSSLCDDSMTFTGEFTVQNKKIQSETLLNHLQAMNLFKELYPSLYKKVKHIEIHKNLNITLSFDNPTFNVDLPWNWDKEEMHKLNASFGYIEHRYQKGYLDLRGENGLFWEEL